MSTYNDVQLNDEDDEWEKSSSKSAIDAMKKGVMMLVFKSKEKCGEKL